ncbi:hypothetical protein SUZIE_173305 [Sciurus carolinensis]|uniref:WKF domain-containing protein n=1 Tax=Sciurus carolinensis TaxID=30640 RepID=A0AA41N4G6_SCICA|nr:hypothetical protein [Sciurus carolinensis]
MRSVRALRRAAGRAAGAAGAVLAVLAVRADDARRPGTRSCFLVHPGVPNQRGLLMCAAEHEQFKKLWESSNQEWGPSGVLESETMTLNFWEEDLTSFIMVSEAHLGSSRMPACERLDDRAGVRLSICAGQCLQRLKAACPDTLCPQSDGSFLVVDGEAASRVQDPGPELSPEERRVLERKLKKERKKEEKNRLREAGIAAAQNPPARRSGAELALDYLCGWAQKHKDWRFQKTRQTWLLLHMYDSDKVPDEHFSTLLAYLEGLKGRARELTVQKAEALIQELDEAGTETALLGKAQRLRQVLQLLS